MTNAETRTRALELLRRPFDAAEYLVIRDLWKQHSIAEDRRDIAGLLATLTPDCVYEIVGAEARWEGHEGAESFYTELLHAFPDIHFDLTDIVIGPQGVCEEAMASGTQQKAWLGWNAEGGLIQFKVVIFFPWDPARQKFKGERIYVDQPVLGKSP